MTYSRLAGTGGYLPEKVLTNAELEKMVDTTDAWIRERTGIHKRHVAADDETTCDLAEHAARRAIEAAGLSAGDIDLIIVATALTKGYIVTTRDERSFPRIPGLAVQPGDPRSRSMALDSKVKDLTLILDSRRRSPARQK